MRTVRSLKSRRSEGRVRRLRELGRRASRQTAQGQPRVGTPMEVPVPRKVRVAIIRVKEGSAV